MAIYCYTTIQSKAEGIYKEKGSKFLAFAFPVSSEEEVKAHLLTLRKKYFDAGHQGYGYILGPDKEKFRAFDDGEPTHSTGDPILGQIRSRNLTNVLVIVVRYFGGVKLGVGGLISAYREAASLALNHARLVEMEVESIIEIVFDFSLNSDIMKLIKKFDLTIREQNFRENGQMVLIVKLRHEQALLDTVEIMRRQGEDIHLRQL